MKKSWLFGVAVLAACGGSGGSAPIDGLYQVTETVTASSCPTVAVGTTSGDTITVTTSGTTATATIASFGGSCPGQIDGEHVTWSCTVTTTQGTATLQTGIGAHLAQPFAHAALWFLRTPPHSSDVRLGNH